MKYSNVSKITFKAKDANTTLLFWPEVHSKIQNNNFIVIHVIRKF